MSNEFIKIGDKVVNRQHISLIDCKNLESKVEVEVWLDKWFKKGFRRVTLRNQEAIDLVMKLCPEFLEGKRFRTIRHAWAIHNLIGHPGLQILAWLKLHKLGFKLHDNTVPRPR